MLGSKGLLRVSATWIARRFENRLTVSQRRLRVAYGRSTSSYPTHIRISHPASAS